ncbi:MAG: ABC transporter substrate-binding protein [Actinomycetia bacterium]|nr:ABC transporter substrate-binding protein [Actinomycetes bacterium]
MRKTRPITRALALAAAGALVLAGCTAVEDEPGTDTTPTDAPTTSEDGATDAETETEGTETGGTAAGEINFDSGVTAEPCPAGINPDNGCIYLGILSDLTEGPFSALAMHITQAQHDYWRIVNEEGGISGFDVDTETNTRDTKYQPQEHATAYQQIEGNILALAQTLGTVNTEAILDDMDANDIVGVPASWWSGYNFNENDRGLILEHGYSYCTEAIVGLDWFTENHAEPTSIAAVGYPGDYGGDSAAGVQKWAEVHGVTDVTVVPTGPNQVTGNQDAVVAAVSAASPDVVVLAIGPAETAEIVGKLAAGGFQGRFLGSLPTWNPALLETAAAPALTAMYNHMAIGEQWEGTSDAIVAMKEALNDEPPVNAGYIIGWTMNYPMHELLQAAADNGDLTRAGVRAAVDGLEVDFGGASPAITYGGDGKDVAVTEMMVNHPDAESELGTSPTTDGFYSGSTFAEVTYDAACAAAS